jgi:hypothetical protein
LLAILAIVVGYAVYLIPSLFEVQGVEGFCLFREVSGIPCPGCGMGKASTMLFSGNISGSLLIHPLALPFAFGAFLSIIWLTVDVLKKRTSLLRLLRTNMKRPYIIIMSFVILTIWFWIICQRGCGV